MKIYLSTLAALALVALLAMSQGCTSTGALLEPVARAGYKWTAEANSVDLAGTVETKRLELLKAETDYRATKAAAAAARATADELITGNPATK
jgi:hypothetical protein